MRRLRSLFERFEDVRHQVGTMGTSRHWCACRQSKLLDLQRYETVEHAFINPPPTYVGHWFVIDIFEQYIFNEW